MKSQLLASILFCALGAMAPCVAYAQAPARPTVTTPAAVPSAAELFKPLTVNQLDQFIDSVRSSVHLETPQENVSQTVDAATSGLWAGSKTNVRSALGELTLKFRPKMQALEDLAATGDSTGSALLESFEVTVNAQPERLFVQHSAVLDRLDQAGFYARLDRLKGPTPLTFVGGQKQSGVYFAIPVPTDPANNWGLFICPRAVGKIDLKGGTGIELQPSSYELSEAFFKVDAEAAGIPATAGQKGRVKVQMFLSSELPQPKVPVDEAVSTMPSASVVYSPATPFDSYRFAPFTDVQQGIVTLVEMQNKAGYIRRQFFNHQRLIHKTDEPSPVSLVIKGHRVSNDIGECYIIIEQKYGWTTYDKQPVTFE